MKKKLFLLLSICCLVAGTAWAESISLSQAKSAASSFMASRVKGAGNMKLAYKASRVNGPMVADKASYYVFNAEQSDKGFVIVAGDDRVPAVLGYSDKGTFDEGKIPQALQQLLDSYAAQIEALDGLGQISLNETPRDPIAPMLTAEWAHQAPYNSNLPYVGSSHAQPGGTTVAMAQVMKYYKWPAQPTRTIPSYVTSSLGITLPALQVTDFDWDVMKNSYMKSDTSSMSAVAVATLFRYCAQAQQLNFMSGSTPTNIALIPLAMSSYFDYQPSAHTIFRVNYTTTEWENIIYNELAMQHPVIYGGSKDTSGFIFVCDGCDSQGLFHINWGLSGQHNGYYRLNVMNLDLLGTGSTSWPSGMVNNQSAIVGLAPGNTEPSTIELTSAQVVLHSYVSTRPSFSDFFSVTVSGQFYNFTSQEFAIDFGWGLYKGDTLIVNAKGGFVKSMKPGAAVTHTQETIQFGYKIGDGNYTFRQIYSRRSANDYHPCVGADKNYLDVVIRGDSVFITPHGNACAPDVSVNSITNEGNMHPNRPVDITLNVTNNGESDCSMLYMHLNGTRLGMGIVSAAQGESTDVAFRYMPTSAGNYVLSFSFNENGSNPIATDTLHIVAMPTAKLTATVTPQNVTDPAHNIITDNKFPLLMTVTNTGTNPYNEDISVVLFKRYDESYPTQLYAVNRHFELGVGETDTLQFDLDGVVDGWQYLVKTYYYSNGNQVSLKNTGTYTIQYPTGLTNSFDVSAVVEPADAGDFSIEGGVIGNHAAAGQVVVFSAVPHEGYEMGELFVIGEGGDTIPVIGENNLYRFTMPESAVTIHVSFVSIHAVNLTNQMTVGGVATVNVSEATVGSEVYVTANPNVGWNLQGVIVTCGEDTVPVSQSADGYFFVMPNGDVTVTADYVRSTGDRFEMVTDINDITPDGIYMIANRQYNGAMKFHEDGERTFMGTAAGEWVNTDKTILMISDQVCMFTVDEMRPVTIENDGTIEYLITADLNTGNGYLNNQSTFLNLSTQPPSRRAFISLDESINNCKLRFAEKTSQLTPDMAMVGYYPSGSRFYVLAGTEPVWLYKLVDAHMVSVLPSEGGAVTVTGGPLADGTVQRGTIVTLSIDAEEGYVLENLTVTTATGDVVEVSYNNVTGVYSFAMPGEDVTIAASFVIPPEHVYEPGDVNHDKVLNISDVTTLINYLLTDDETDVCLVCADVNGDHVISISDVTDLISILLTNP